MEKNRSFMAQKIHEMGEPSTTRRTRTASASDAADFSQDRPFKKARYVWQLKGKYHLKADCAKNSTIRNRYNHRNYSNTSDTDSDSENKKNHGNKKADDAILMNTLLLRSSALLEEEDFNSRDDIDCSIMNDIPITLVKSSSQYQDEFLQRWHRRQMAKGYLDNTINSLLELWKIAPCQAADLVENCENEEQVEDESILMAIQSHGLQTGFCPSGESATASTSHNSNCPLKKQYNEVSSTVPSNNNQSDSGDSDDNFLSAAVSVAIQKKGLSSNYG